MKKKKKAKNKMALFCFYPYRHFCSYFNHKLIYIYNIFKFIIILNFEINALMLDLFFYMKKYRIHTTVFNLNLHFSICIWYDFVEESKGFKMLYGSIRNSLYTLRNT